MNLDSLIRAVQKSLGVKVDGKPGPETWAADLPERVMLAQLRIRKAEDTSVYA
jgi:hypothetical protein